MRIRLGVIPKYQNNSKRTAFKLEHDGLFDSNVADNYLFGTNQPVVKVEIAGIS